MLAWGDAVFLPSFYTLQAQYAGRYPINLSRIQVIIDLTLGLMGYLIFRSANEQKDHLRQMDGEATVWGRPATFKRARYRTTNGKEHSSTLLTCGWLGICRHANYTSDILMSFAMCAAYGALDQLLPWSSFLYMTLLLMHRTWRDEKRCAAKYGETWKKCCRLVPWRLMPGLY